MCLNLSMKLNWAVFRRTIMENSVSSLKRVVCAQLKCIPMVHFKMS